MTVVYSWMKIPLAKAGLVALILASMAPLTARAQGGDPSTPSTPVSDPAPRPLVIPAMGDAIQQPDPVIPMRPSPPANFQELPPARVTMRPIDVIAESIFGKASADEWQPLSLSTFFSDGWDRPWVRSPPGTNGAPKQNWFGTADAVFARLDSLTFFNVNGMTNHTGLLLTPVP
jgi:hypothetical protein